MTHPFNHRPVPRVCKPIRSVHPDTLLYGFDSENIFTKLKIRNYKKWKNLGGKGKERRWLSRFMRGIFRDFRRMANSYKKVDWS